MERNWLNHYPKGVPATIDVTQYASATALIEESFKNFAARDAYACMDKRLTFAELDRASRAVGAWLRARAEST